MNSQHTKPAPSAAESKSSSAIKPPELRFLLPEEPTSLKTVFGGAGLTHAAFVLLLVFLAWVRPDRQIQAVLPDLLPDDIVFIEQPGPGGGGGGGGNKMPDPPKVEKLPAVKPPEPTPLPTPVPEPPPPPEPLAEAPIITPTEAPAVIGTAPALSASLGKGTDNGAGTGDGGGAGPGKGDGVGPGEGGGIGGGVFQVGNGVLSPILLPPKPKPLYTSEAMLRRIQGEVWLDCVVEKTGGVGKCDIVKSLDSNNYGLDTEAMKAAKQFKFRPGTRFGEPVAVLVRIQLEFNMR